MEQPLAEERSIPTIFLITVGYSMKHTVLSISFIKAMDAINQNQIGAKTTDSL